MRGRPPKMTRLHLLQGTARADRHKNRKFEPHISGKPEKPDFLIGRASELWDFYAEIGYWLTKADTHELAAWSSMCVEIETDLKKMSSVRISQWRLLAASLGFDCATRSRINASDGSKDRENEEAYA